MNQTIITFFFSIDVGARINVLSVIYVKGYTHIVKNMLYLYRESAQCWK